MKFVIVPDTFTLRTLVSTQADHSPFYTMVEISDEEADHIERVSKEFIKIQTYLRELDEGEADRL